MSDLDSLVYRPSQQQAPTSTPAVQPSGQPQQEELISFDDPRFIEDLIASGSPEAAEKLWADLTGANRVTQQVDQQVAALLQANPDLPYNRAQYIAEAEKARLRSQAPGLQALEIAKQRLTEKQEAAKGVQSKFTGDQWALLQELLASGVPSIEATRQVVEKIPFSSTGVSGGGGKDGEGGSTNPKNMDMLSAQTQAALKGVYNAEQINQLRGALGNKDTAATLAHQIANTLNTPNVTGEDPESLMQQEEIDKVKGEARAQLSLLTDMQRLGLGTVGVAKTAEDIEAAYDRGVPVLIELPSGEFEFMEFKSDKEYVNYVKQKFTQSEENKPQAEAPKEKSSWLVGRLGKFTGLQNATDTDKEITRLKELLEDPDTATRLDAKRKLLDEENYKKTLADREAGKKEIQEYIDLQNKVATLREIAGDTRLGAEEKAAASKELTTLESRMGELWNKGPNFRKNLPIYNPTETKTRWWW